MVMWKIILLSLILSACGTVEQKLDPDLFYRRDMWIEVNGTQGMGVLVAPYADSYEVKIRARGDLDLFTMTTCHQEQSEAEAGERGWFGDKRKREFKYNPAPGIEQNGLSCPMHLGGYHEAMGRHSWGMIEFEHPSLTLEAELRCNGLEEHTKGVSICQSKVGLIQEIIFEEPVLYSESQTCAKIETINDRVFRLIPNVGECGLRFLAKADGAERWHRLTIIGYEKILIPPNDTRVSDNKKKEDALKRIRR